MANIKLTQPQVDLIFGTMLGDGNLQTENQGRTWRYRATHGLDQKDYIFHKYEVLQNLCLTPPKLQEKHDKRNQQTYYSYYFNTITAPFLKFYGDMFYNYDPIERKFVKCVPKYNTLKKMLTKRAIAYFYMDDGSLKSKNNSNAMRLCTENFTNVENQRIVNVIRDKYAIQLGTIKHKKPERTRIVINEAPSTAFRELIKPYLVDSMKYKVSSLY